MGSTGQPLIASERSTSAPPEVVHALLIDIGAWPLWSPHISSTQPPTGSVQAGTRVRVKPWFAPAPTEMLVTWEDSGRGMDWHSHALGHILRYRQRITPEGDGSRVRFEASVEGPLGALLTKAAGPLSGYGQRRRLARLARLAEFTARRAG